MSTDRCRRRNEGHSDETSSTDAPLESLGDTAAAQGHSAGLPSVTATATTPEAFGGNSLRSTGEPREDEELHLCHDASTDTVVARLLSEPEQVQAEVEHTLHQLHSRYSQMQQRLEVRQERRVENGNPASPVAVPVERRSPAPPFSSSRSPRGSGNGSPADERANRRSRSPPSSKKHKTTSRRRGP